MKRRRGRPPIGVGGAVERFADRAVAGGPDQVVGFEVRGLEQLGESGLCLGFA